MGEKSFIYSLFSKYLDEDDDTATDGVKNAGNEAHGSQKSHTAEEPEDEKAMIETVEDWNEKERRKKERAMAVLNGENLPDETEENAQGEETPPASVEEITADASVELTVSPDKMTASVILTGPTGGGRDILERDLKDVLEDNGIVFGIDGEKLREIVDTRAYRQMFIIARGQPPVNGQNGKIKDYYPRQHQLKYATRENGNIDFKSLNLIHNVKKGEVICEITRPTEPEDGMDVFGEPVKGKMGVMPPIPQGKNVVYSPEKDKLVSACEGNLSFRSGRFQVENVFQVNGNVDNSVGNVDFSGSVLIRGDVLEGFHVKAKGDITVMGIVEGAFLKAGGNILLHKGMRGMRSGVLEADGSVTAKFLEDCKIYARGDIQAEYIINSEVSCENNLTLLGRRGAFIGGKCNVFNLMKVKAVGAESHIPTQVTLGVTPQQIAQVEEIAEELKTITQTLEECQKNIAYLSARQKSGSITPKQSERLNELKLKLPVNSLKQKQLKTTAAQIAQKIREVGKTRLTAGEVYPGTVICIGDSKLTISRKEDHCSFYYLDGEIKKGL